MVPTNVYIDGLNFYYGAVKGTPYKWVDFAELARTLVPHDEIGRIKYFTAQVTDRYPGDETPRRQNVFLRAVRTDPRIEIMLGHFRSDVKWRSFPIREQRIRDLLSPPFEPDGDAQRMWESSQTRRTRPFSAAKVTIREEKGSDVNLAVQLLWDVLHGHCEKALVVSNDSDLEHAIALVVQAGAEIGIVNPHPQATSRHLRNAATFEIPFRSEVLAKC